MFALSSAPVVLRALRAESVSTIPPFISTEPGPVAAFPLRTNFSKRAGRIEHNCETFLLPREGACDNAQRSGQRVSQAGGGEKTVD
jgi:hypothetical protein